MSLDKFKMKGITLCNSDFWKAGKGWLLMGSEKNCNVQSTETLLDPKAYIFFPWTKKIIKTNNCSKKIIKKNKKIFEILEWEGDEI